MTSQPVELITYQKNTGDSTRRRYIRDGIAGNYDVVFEMVRLIREGNKDYKVKNIAADILKTRNLTSYANGVRILQAVFSYVTDKVDYIQDSAGAVESVKSAYRTLLDGYGDCDDLTITTATLAGALGFEKTAIVLAKYDKNDVTFSHVYTVVYYNDKRYVLDASLPDAVFNSEVKPFEVSEIFPFESIQGLDGLSGIWTNTRAIGRKLAGVAINTLPNVANYMPLSFLSSSALQTGAAMLQATRKNKKSLNETASLINAELDEIIAGLITGKLALDLAQSYAVQSAAQLSLIENIENPSDYQTIKKKLADKIDFIKNYKAIAKRNNLPCAELNANAMLLVGAGAAGFGAYKLYKLLTKGKE